MKVTKILLTSMSLPAVATPLVTLTSCAQAWAYKTPFMIGSMTAGGPYPLYGGMYDYDGHDMSDYLQSQYAIQTASSTNYAYSTPYKFNDKEAEKGEWEPSTPAWRTSADEAFVATANDKVGEETKQVTSASNSAMASNIDFIATIGSSINSYINYALQYQAQQVNKNNEDNLNIAWGGQGGFTLDHGKKDGSDGEQRQNNQFYEYVLANANVNGLKKIHAMLKTSNINFNFATMPLPTYNWDGDIRKGLHTEGFVYSLEGVNGKIENPKYYSNKPSEGEEKDGDITYKYKIYQYDAVPFVVMLNNITQTYLDVSKKADSFLVNDYYATSNDVKDSIGDQWKNILPELTNITKDNAIPSNKTFVLIPDDNAKKFDTGSPTADQRIVYWTQMPGNAFIALLGYSVKVYYTENAGNIEWHHEKDVATISGIQNFFPSYFLDLYKDSIYKKIDNELAEADRPYIIDTNKVNNINNKFLELIRRTAHEGLITDLSKLSDESKKLLSFLGYMFGDNDNKIDTNFINYVEPIS